MDDDLYLSRGTNSHHHSTEKDFENATFQNN